MAYIVLTCIGAIGGGICVFVAMLNRHYALDAQHRQQQLRAEEINNRIAEVNSRAKELAEQASQLDLAESKLSARVISLQELQDENLILKRDLRNLNFHLRKLELDIRAQTDSQKSLDERSQELGSRYLKENVKWVSSSLNPNNYAMCKQRLQDAIDRVRGIGFEVTQSEELQLVADLKQEYELVVRAAFEREEQARIRAQIREEQMREREVQRELQQLQRERDAIQAALEKALAEAHDQHSEEVEKLQARLAEAEARSQRAMSQAQLTKAGHVYVISNIGSFGEGVFKVGMTRRLEPRDRVCELGDASVPFPFDVHMMISCDDAPSLENAIHRKLHKNRINKINPRREFFRSDVATIYQIVKEHHGEVQYTADAEALQYRQSLSVSDDDQEYIEGLYSRFDDDGDAAEDAELMPSCENGSVQSAKSKDGT